MKKWFIAGVGAAGLLMASAAMARVDIGVSIGIPGVVYGAPVYVAPQPVYVAPPPPVHYHPAPVYRPRYVHPVPVYYGGHKGHHKHKKHWKHSHKGHHHHHHQRGPGAVSISMKKGGIMPPFLHPTAPFRRMRRVAQAGLPAHAGFFRPSGGRHGIGPAPRTAGRPPPTVMRTCEQIQVHH